MKSIVYVIAFLFLAGTAQAQIQVELKFKRLQYIAHEPVFATVKITNLAGRDIDLHDENDQHWFGFEINGGENRLLAPVTQGAAEPALHIEAGKTVTRKINLTPIFPVQDFGAYHVRANVYFADLNKFYYSPTKVFQVTDARPIWQKTVGVPDRNAQRGPDAHLFASHESFPGSHVALRARGKQKQRRRLHHLLVRPGHRLRRTAGRTRPRESIARSSLRRAANLGLFHIGWNGELLAHSIFMETKTRPRLRHAADGAIAVSGGVLDAPVAQSARNPAPKLSARPPTED